MPRRTDSKEHLARTALSLFVERGITETSIRDIVAGAGFASEGTFYRHYASKEDMAWELFSRNLGDLAADLERLCRARATLKAQNEAMVRRFCALFDEDPVLFRYLLLTQHAQHKKITPESYTPFTVIQGAITRAMARREIPRRDPILMTAMVLGLVRQVAVSHVIRRLEGPMAEDAETLVAASWRVLAA